MSALGFFGGEDVSSSSDEETVEVEGVERKPSSGNYNEDHGKDKLPSPTALLSSVQRPEFLKSADAQARRDLIAEKRAHLEQERLNTCGTHASKGIYGAVAPPVGIDSMAVVSAKPVRYEARMEKNVAEAVAASTEAVKRPQPDDSGVSVTKKKVETFRQKEKRKRDLGQSSREKSYVEEEKRLLRQSLKEGADVYGGD